MKQAVYHVLEPTKAFRKEMIAPVAPQLAMFVSLVHVQPELFAGLLTRRKEGSMVPGLEALLNSEYEVLYLRLVFAMVFAAIAALAITTQASTVRPSVAVAGLPRLLQARVRPVVNALISAIVGLGVTVAAVKLGILLR